MAQIDSEWEQLLKKSQPRNFSDSIVFDILSRLPVKSILRFKSVSKKWYVLFKDPPFIETHLNRSIEGHDGCYLVRQCNYYYDETGSPRRALFSLRSEETFKELCELHFEPEPFEPKPLCRYEIISSAGGIVCIRKLYIGPRFTSDLYIWNPATRELRILPKFPCQDYSLIPCLGFGFDPKNYDYKIVAISCCKDSYRVNVYSLRADGWRVVEVDFSDNQLQRTMVHVNDRMHWLGHSPLHDLIFSFDVTEEEIIKMDVPKLDPDNFAILRKAPASLGKSLILCELEEDLEVCKVWFMKEYGDSQSWAKLYYFPSHPIYKGCVDPCIFLDNGKIIMQSDNNLILYDSKNHVYEILNVDRDFDVVKYKESLVSVKGGGSISNLNHCASISDSFMG